MNRRKFLSRTVLLTGALTLNPFDLFGKKYDERLNFKGKKAKNIIFMISDGMSNGTLSMANLYSKNILGKETHWMNLYLENKVSRALMDTASASSIVTDSAAASSSFGSGFRVNNGSLNVGINGEHYLPIWQKFKKKGKKAGCVTTVTITHATPAGFCINSAKRSAEPDIAEMYGEFGFDFMMGGGDEFFNPEKRTDKKDVYAAYQKRGYQILKNRSDLKNIDKNKPVLGVFNTGALPYTIDRNNTPNLQHMPTLAEMAKAAIEHMKDNKEGFVLQIEAGKVDWAAHANDVSALLHDQLAFDEAIKVAMAFAEKDKNTLVIITTDHGNANPGTIYGADATKNFNSIAHYKCTNEYLLNNLHADFNIQQVKDWIAENNQISVYDDEAKRILNFYNGIEKDEEGLYNYKKLPYRAFSEIQKKHNSVGWISMDHSSDYVELAIYGPGSEFLQPFVKNTDLHYLMLKAAEVENNF
ncbi:alkaline phosphatase [Chryseobacterium salviniae]|uniref:Alkaline phosphatase n=1 Tax=Chryseobacterium salviniae TaxID=3101750 RepID=A0ABU6HXA9_9FLAO|nr:alkaline phosphatase [Chryseobacterium sp. T9W2-O]MEC3877379.1 alkaline phosphatase [Chryseobacterium sp. T9W2-O]